MSISASSQTTYSEICEDSTKNKKDEFSIRAGNTTEEVQEIRKLFHFIVKNSIVKQTSDGL